MAYDHTDVVKRAVYTYFSGAKTTVEAMFDAHLKKKDPQITNSIKTQMADAMKDFDLPYVKIDPILIKNKYGLDDIYVEHYIKQVGDEVRDIFNKVMKKHGLSIMLGAVASVFLLKDQLMSYFKGQKQPEA